MAEVITVLLIFAKLAGALTWTWPHVFLLEIGACIGYFYFFTWCLLTASKLADKDYYPPKDYESEDDNANSNK